MAGKPSKVPIADRLNAKTLKQPGGCWLWQGGKITAGYGQISYLGRALLVHRVSYEVHKGPIPEGMFILHSCDTPACINPEHLSLGTQKDNMVDASRKGRVPRGEVNAHAKLTPEQVREISELYATRQFSQVELASRYGIAAAVVSNIVTGKSWKHLGVKLEQRKSRGSSGDKNGARLHPEKLVRGEEHRMAKFTDEMVQRARELIAEGKTQKAVSAMLGISPTQVGRIARGEARRTA